MQLSIFDEPAESTMLPTLTGEKAYFEKWRMLEILDSLNGQKFLIRGKDEYQEFCLPFLGGEMSYSSIYRTGFPAVCEIGTFHFYNGRPTSFVRLNGFMKRIIRNHDLLTFNYDREVHRSNEKKKIFNEDSVVSFDLSPNFFDLGSSKKKAAKSETYDEWTLVEKIASIVGNTYAVQVRCHNDLFTEIISYPSRINDIQVDGDVLTIEGSNHLSIKATGFVKMRYSNGILLDIYNQEGGYTRTIHLLSMNFS